MISRLSVGTLNKTRFGTYEPKHKVLLYHGMKTQFALFSHKLCVHVIELPGIVLAVTFVLTSHVLCSVLAAVFVALLQAYYLYITMVFDLGFTIKLPSIPKSN
ncbi:uncharacterized protein LOC116248468 [Nymphaea colorata]|uniref:uncharacterized protein LOC116248468 n=1 Tax=Nymphaea colorata TaxID=210225 RepID=UPI00129D2EC7|nr:uncharacterized protein LOC116248468 [Nymphaea colorata]